MDHCAECGFDYRSVRSDNAPDRIRDEAGRLADLINSADPDLMRRRTGSDWSALDYAGHVRDMLLVQRDRVLAARIESGRPITPMGRDERVAWGEYDVETPATVATDILRAAERFGHTLSQLGADDWARTMLYNYPVREERSLVWVAAHTTHEIVHHRDDIDGLLH